MLLEANLKIKKNSEQQIQFDENHSTAYNTLCLSENVWKKR